MNEVTPTYHAAVKAVRDHAEDKQAKLDAIALLARAKNIQAHRDGATQGVPQDSQGFPICALVAQTIVIGSDDGYPQVKIPTETRAVLRAAVSAGLLPMESNGSVKIGILKLYNDLSGMADKLDVWQSDYNAWDEADKYRKAQSHSKL